MVEKDIAKSSTDYKGFLYTEAALQRCPQKKVFWKYILFEFSYK